MNRIELKFKKLRKAGKKAFIAFITVGYPDLSTTEKLVKTFADIGVDIVELGVPFSDPMADGLVIQESSQAALKKNAHLVDILETVKKLRKSVEIPVCLMTYYNPIFCFGTAKFAQEAKKAGVDAVIIPDLPPEEDPKFMALARKNNLDVVCFISPTTPDKRMRYLANCSRGFIYYVSLTGVTGVRGQLPLDLKKHLGKIKKITNKPVCVGFGISSPKQVRQVYGISDGVIVGSAIVKEIKKNLGKNDMIKRVAKFVANLKNV